MASNRLVFEPQAKSNLNPSGIERSCGHSLTLKQISHHFGATVALRDVNLGVNPGEFISLLGPSGCGKTTLLRLISGFYTPTSGQILIDGQNVEAVLPNQRGVGIVFQNYALFPHMTVWNNVAYGLRAKQTSKAQIRTKVGEMLDLVKLSDFRDRYPSQLSGGQQQRVALARAMAVEPKLLLLDEPFSALDKNLRLDMQIEMKRLLVERGITTVLVTHDQEEALSLSDRIAVISQGIVHQFDTPSQIYDSPETRFVSTFVGTCNVLQGQLLERAGSECLVAIEDQIFDVETDVQVALGSPIEIAVRPESWRFQTEPGRGRLPVKVELALSLGATVVYELHTPTGTEIKVTQPRTKGVSLLEPGETTYLELISPQACSVFEAS
ncbi:ABC transporter ATP-binding protein [Leptolyngbya sp. NK1-12]|uniref:ABC-type quaternary amine transporter n=1 Tax=Leptolyngbya sp. NK1-12 TaxID=2547451 RepID=A0AA96WMH9_9CYAN|nr:ABC transporter ATP-binding protein [Leptolyngbya sp. NK1-12]WNZ24131.1 ABC transporter ATP-binding protein [Leptolyngbya sp. NK1-12]